MIKVASDEIEGQVTEINSLAIVYPSRLRGRATLDFCYIFSAWQIPFPFPKALLAKSLLGKDGVCSSISVKVCCVILSVCYASTPPHRWQGTPNNVKESKLMETVQNKTLYL